MRPAFFFIFAAAICISSSDACSASEAIQVQEDEYQSGSGIRSSFSYCGIYALHRALGWAGKDVPFPELVRKEYIGSRWGSSAEELIRAAADFGVECELVGNISCSMLQSISTPVLLHTRSTLYTSEFDHWVLYMGVSEGKAVIYDNLAPRELIGFDELAAIWDGTGLVTSIDNSDQSHWTARFSAIVPWAAFSGFGILLVLTARQLELAFGKFFVARKFPLFASEISFLLFVSACSSLAFRHISPMGYLSFTPAIKAIQETKIESFLPKVSLGEVSKLVQHKDAVFIDARFREDYNFGHISGAVNCPPSMTTEDILAIVKQIPTTTRIVVYCQSSNCSYSGSAAKKLIDVGFSNVAIFKGGWNEWKQEIERERPPKNQVGK